jgi:hypothetical protein
MNARARLGFVVAVLVAAGGFVAWWVTRESEGPRLNEPVLPESATGAVADAGSRPASSPAAALISPKRLEASDEAAATAALDPSRLYVAGKVIDDRRLGVPGASIELVTEGREPLRSRTAPDGRFVIDCGAKPAAPPRGAVEASDASGRVALVALPDEDLAGNVIDLGNLAVAEPGILTVRVLKDGAGVAAARVWIGPMQKLGLGPFVTDAAGTLGPKRVPEGACVVRAFSSDLASRGEARVDVTRSGAPPVEINLVAAWRLGVTVKDASTGRGAPDRAIAVTSIVRTSQYGMSAFGAPLPRSIARTNADGRTVVEGLAPDQAVEVEVVPADAVPSSYPRMNDTRTKVEPGAAEVVLLLNGGGETFTFPLEADETDGPPDGAEIRLSALPGTSSAPPPAKGKVVGRNLVVEHLTERTRSALATAPDGSMARLRISNDQMAAKVGSEARFKRPRALVVTVRDRFGAPLAGLLVQCRLQGDAAVGRQVTTGADGTARIEGLYPQSVTVHVRRSGESGDAASGAADLTPPGDGRVDVTLESERACVLHVTVDGVKRLPPSFHVGIIGPQGIAHEGVGPVDEDPDSGTLRFGLRPDPGAESITLAFSAQGFPHATVRLPVTKDGAPLEGTVALTSGATLRVKVVPPADGVQEVGYEVWQSGGSWAIREFAGQVGEMGKRTGRHEAAGLPAGRYRARDALTGLASEPVELAAGSAAEVTLDLSGAGIVTGRVEGPADAAGAASARPGPAEARFASVSVEGTGLVGRGGGIFVPINGEFQARVPGDRPVTFRVKHAVFSPDPEKGSATVTAPGSSVVLKLVRGAELRFRVRSESRQGSVLFFDGKPDGPPAQALNFVSDDGVCQVGGFKPGKRTLVIEMRSGAPFVREDVELGEGVTDLGEIAFPEGATVRVKALVREGQAVPQMTVNASRLDPPGYSRSGTTDRSGEVLVKGLGPGRFRVDVITGNRKAVAGSYEVLSTGSGEIPLTVDLR